MGGGGGEKRETKRERQIDGKAGRQAGRQEGRKAEVPSERRGGERGKDLDQGYSLFGTDRLDCCRPCKPQRFP